MIQLANAILLEIARISLDESRHTILMRVSMSGLDKGKYCLKWLMEDFAELDERMGKRRIIK
jgi:hypothetical protein